MRKSKYSSKNIKNFLYVPDSKDPDLIIRTGGEMRLSNFMLWQSAYSELYFTRILWPDFKVKFKPLDNFIRRIENMANK